MLDSFSVCMTEAVCLTAKFYRVFLFVFLATPAEDRNKKYCFILIVILNVFGVIFVMEC